MRQRPAPPPEVATTLLDRVEGLVAESRAIAHAAKSGQQWVAATSALREVRCCLELLGKLTGQISTSFNFNTFNFDTVSEDKLIECLDAIAKRQDAAAVRFRQLVKERLGAPQARFIVNFVDPPQLEGSTLQP